MNDAIVQKPPRWYWLVSALAVIWMLFGVLAVSLGAVILQFGYVFLAMDAIARLGAASAVPFPLVIFAIGAALLWFSLAARRRQWIG